jgi:hypothetical protein
MKIALIKTNLKNQNQQVINNNQQQGKDRETETVKLITKEQGAGSKMETHLTIIGVCTTICPENSGT